MSVKDKVLYGAIGTIGAGIAAWRCCFPYIRDDIRYIKARQRTAKAAKKDVEDNKHVIDMFEESVKNYPKKTFIIFEDKEYSYELVDSMANRVAYVVSRLGFKANDIVAMMVSNEPAFIWILLGLQKLGIGAAFINFHLKSRPLTHSINTSNPKALIVGEGQNLLHAIEEIKDDLAAIPIFISGRPTEHVDGRFSSFDDLMMTSLPVQVCKCVREDVQMTDTLCYIYTTGTTGLPKPAVINQFKAIGLANVLQQFSINHDDILYVVTPLYHMAASTLGWWNTMKVGGTLVLGRKFSASNYFNVVRKHDVTVILYIGELCRYLLNVPKSNLDTAHKLRCATGNGLKPDVWKKFQERFRIPLVVELFGQTEGTMGIWSNLNRPGCIGRLSPLTNWYAGNSMPKMFLVKTDPHTYEPLRDKYGRCILSQPGEEGLLISEIPPFFDIYGFYKGSKEIHEKKLVRNAFKDGDVYFNFGDLLYRDRQYYLYFQDRVGDTYRWKGENISAGEVTAVLSELPFVQDINVYGVIVEGAEGKAGMAAITLHKDETVTSSLLKSIYKHVEKELPASARPVFLRMIPEQIVTQTFKHKKVELAKEGIDPAKISDPLYVINNATKTYEPLNTINYKSIMQSRL